MVPPKRFLFLLLVVFGLLLIWIIIFPTGKIVLSQDLTLNFTSFDVLLGNKPSLEKNTKVNTIVSTQNKDTVDLFAIDSPKKTTQSTSNPLFDVNNYTQLDSIKYVIELPTDNKQALYPFFQSLDSIAQPNNNQLIRVFHYGDSQIEGDRITSTLREKLQRQFGGSGVGLFGLMEVNEIRSSLEMKSSKGWVKSAIYGRLNLDKSFKKYGPMVSVFRYYGINNDSVAVETIKPFVTFRKSKSAYSRARKMDKFSLFYVNNTTQEGDFSISFGKKTIPDKLPISPVMAQKSWMLNDSFKSVTLQFFPKEGIKSPDLYACSFDGERGIAVDNIAMRGASGTDFHRMDNAYYATLVKQLNVKLMIVQFGVNVVPTVLSNYDFYEKQYTRELFRLRKNNPDVAILVVGVSDVAIKEGVDYISSPNIESIRDAQRNAAMKTGCAFWDLYQAMGGKNSMVQWVNATPSLAEKDFTHFNFRGARIIGEMLYNAIIKEYVAYKKNLVLN
jgi:lysophospholipase L1-like esterase